MDNKICVELAESGFESSIQPTENITDTYEENDSIEA